MPDSFFVCLYRSLIARPVTTLSTVLNFLVILIVLICGLVLNTKFWRILQEEKRVRVIGRRGNVIEPVMSWFCILQMIFWPYALLFLWVNANEIISSDSLPSWLCALLFVTLRIGRMCIAYNSLFVAVIRYIFIVKHKTSNQWNYEKLSKWFQIASIVVPILVETLGIFTITFERFWNVGKIKECSSLNKSLSTIVDADHLTLSPFANLTLQYLPASLVEVLFYIHITITLAVCLNISEAFLYFQIFRHMKRFFKLFLSNIMHFYHMIEHMFVCLKLFIFFCRSNEDSFTRGVVSEASYNYGNKRRIVSLKICFMSWIYELIGTGFTALVFTFRSLGFYHLWLFPDAIVIFVIIPFIHIMNDEDTKAIIAEEGWVQGIRYMLNIRNQVEPVAVVLVVQAEPASPN